MIQTIKQSNILEHEDGRKAIIKMIKENDYTYKMLSEIEYINRMGNHTIRVNESLAGSSLILAEEKYKKMLDRYEKLGYVESKYIRGV